MALALFAGLLVSEHDAVVGWYSRLFGSEPSFAASDTESVWRLADDRWVYVQQNPAHAGHGALMVLVDDLEGTLAGIAGRGLTPARREDYPGGMQKAVFGDADGNEVGFGGIVVSPPPHA
ncbi:VOC family protein [Actinomycetospora sp. TBRC 11914]|uniref:VOC family protein n=1 Tax=Actinomycetospora sp. TBRC 11914 TaxID=2729387 RepID=UPI00145D2DE0|nr:VOC family protein [Actinomycetospora sp. TBRC 11914]NMO93092.1 VOC family protein [Actinomycetospora sp. TBRC 11914]